MWLTAWKKTFLGQHDAFRNPGRAGGEQQAGVIGLPDLGCRARPAHRGQQALVGERSGCPGFPDSDQRECLPQRRIESVDRACQPLAEDQPARPALADQCRQLRARQPGVADHECRPCLQHVEVDFGKLDPVAHQQRDAAPFADAGSAHVGGEPVGSIVQPGVGACPLLHDDGPLARVFAGRPVQCGGHRQRVVHRAARVWLVPCRRQGRSTLRRPMTAITAPSWRAATARSAETRSPVP